MSVKTQKRISLFALVVSALVISVGPIQAARETVTTYGILECTFFSDPFSTLVTGFEFTGPKDPVIDKNLTCTAALKRLSDAGFVIFNTSQAASLGDITIPVVYHVVASGNE